MRATSTGPPSALIVSRHAVASPSRMRPASTSLSNPLGEYEQFLDGVERIIVNHFQDAALLVRQASCLGRRRHFSFPPLGQRGLASASLAGPAR
jgi:hypothetical protein